MTAVPANRIRSLNAAPPNAAGSYVLYWMTACRRTTYNYGLQRAVAWTRDLGRPLVVVETLTGGGRWDSDRQRAFLLQGMADNARALGEASVSYRADAARSPEATRERVWALTERACVVVTDDHPLRETDALANAVAGNLRVRVESVDSNGLLPIRAAGRTFPTAYLFRRYLQAELAQQLQAPPMAQPLAALPRRAPRVLPDWPAARVTELPSDGASGALGPSTPSAAGGPPPVAGVHGGSSAAGELLHRFLQKRLPRYLEERDHPDDEATSELAPYLRHGHISAHEIVTRALSQEGGDMHSLPPQGKGARSGWWGVSASAEAFLDQLVTWRELGLNTCVYRSDYDQFSSLPEWARRTLLEHQADLRPVIYSYAEMEQAGTHDRLWNAAQRQLVREGRMHNYLRMVWGKRILEWTPTPQEALEVMIGLNNTYALDAEDPNSYTGMLWVLGRHDRPWGPKRPIFGTVRCMSSESAARKLRVKGLLERYGT